MPFASQEARREYARRRYANSLEARRKAAENSAAYRHKSPEGRERWRQWKRNARAKKGATALSLIRERQQDGLAAQNARHAWRWWLKNAPDGWIAAYYQSMGRPWSNPRLDEAEQYRLRYRLDPAYAQRERERISNRRFEKPEYGKMWEKVQGRWLRATQSSDASIDAAYLKAMRLETHCAYCHDAVPPHKRHLDHVWPLAKGGAHSADNLVMACAECNLAKRDRMPLQYMLQCSGSHSEGSTRVVQAPSIWDM